MQRRRFEGFEVIARAVEAHPEVTMDLIDRLYLMARDVFNEDNRVTKLPDRDQPDRYSTPFDNAVLFFKLEEETVVVRFLQITFWDDFNPN
jgi:hypothetical protein